MDKPIFDFSVLQEFIWFFYFCWGQTQWNHLKFRLCDEPEWVFEYLTLSASQKQLDIRQCRPSLYIQSNLSAKSFKEKEEAFSHSILQWVG
jgi:hypothetical protein